MRIIPINSSGEAFMQDSEGETVPATQTEQTQHYLRQFLQESAPLLLGIIRSYIVRMGMAQGAAVQSLATEVLHDAALEALPMLTGSIVQPSRGHGFSSSRPIFSNAREMRL